jgi:NitT/TauT family transport system substrate-binding protein
MKPCTFFLAVPFLAALSVAAGCTGSSNTPGSPVKLKVAYLGLTCEAPIFVAQ